jgi:hypothetical protein
MAEPEVEAAWRAELKRSGATQLRDANTGGGVTNEPAAIGRYIDPSLDWLCRKQTEPSYRTANPKGARGHCSWNNRKFL